MCTTTIIILATLWGDLKTVKPAPVVPAAIVLPTGRASEVQALTAAITRRDYVSARLAAKRLRQSPALPEALIALIEASRSKDEVVRWIAVKVLTELGAEAKDVAPQLQALCADADFLVRCAARDALKAVEGRDYSSESSVVARPVGGYELGN